jgi:predicted O-methyltransferase YrrM
VKKKIQAVIDGFLKLFPYTRKLVEYKPIFVAPGHFYSPIPSIEEIKKREGKIFNYSKKEIPAVQLKEKEQLQLLDEVKKFYPEIPFTPEKNPANRFYYNNSMFSYSDVIFLYSIMRQFCPNKIIEIGSGFSSAAMLDISEKFFSGKIHCSFIEPFPDRLNTLLKEKDHTNKNIEIVKDFAENVNLSYFKGLEKNDILFIDSSHVAKIGSDVCYFLFEVLPVLKQGVIIHFHDIFNNFEYPKEWIYEGRAWNEAYMLRAFLQYNDSFEIILFNSFLEDTHEEWFKKNMPLCLTLHEKRKNKNGDAYFLPNRGQSIWLRKL